MNIGILGTGMVGRALGTKLVALGHAVMLGSRTAANETAAAWAAAQGARATHGTFEQAARHGELVINALQGAATLPVLGDLAAALAGKVLLDVANPLDFSKGAPPTLFIVNDSSLGERVQALLPRTRVVKSLNTMSCAVMVEPSRVKGAHDVFVCGDDAGAKAQVIELLNSFGWPAPIDLGGLSAARGTEQLLPVWLRLWQVLGTVDFNFHIAR